MALFWVGVNSSLSTSFALIFRTICDYSFCRVIEHAAEGAYEQWRSTRIFSGVERRDLDSEQVALNRNNGGAQERKYSHEPYPTVSMSVIITA